MTHALVSAGVIATKEPVSLMCRDGKCPDGMTQIPWRSVKLLVWKDDNHQHHSNLTLLPQLTDKERWQKWLPSGNVKTTLSYPRQTCSFQLPHVETLGPMSDSAYEFFEILFRKITDMSVNSREVSCLFRRLSVIIQRFNVALFHDAFTLHDSLDPEPFKLLLPVLLYCL